MATTQQAETGTSRAPRRFTRDGSTICLGDALTYYEGWGAPTVIISDGPYGLGSFPGDPPTPEGLGAWYKPHLEAWNQRALPSTTLWFWNSELGWASVHKAIADAGWEYRCCHVWNKGIGHVAGNSNTKTLRKFPVVTEVCVQYVKKVLFEVEGTRVSMREWLRHEWERSGLPLSRTNEACSVRNAATRKYFTQDHLWYFPPPEAMAALVEYATRHGRAKGRPYFSLDGIRPVTQAEWASMRAKFYCHNGTTNVWEMPAVRGSERLKEENQCIHMNQKPLSLLELCIRASSDEGDVIWEPFGGLCSASIAAHKLKRRSFAAEVLDDYYHTAIRRLATYDSQPNLAL